MGIKILFLRHKTTPEVGGCRWCGHPRWNHDGVGTPWRHEYDAPTQTQRVARAKARAFDRLTFTLP